MWYRYSSHNSVHHSIVIVGEDYDWTKNQIVFEMGSVKGDRHCFQITITDDLTSELVERFYVHAHVFTNGSWVESRSGSVSGSGSGSSGTTSGESSLTDELHFGGALNSPVGSVEVLITDNDGIVDKYTVERVLIALFFITFRPFQAYC